MNLLQTLASAVSLYVLYTAFCLYQNYTRAKTSGFKLRVTPFQIGTLSFAILFGPFLGLVKHFLPDSLSRTFDLGVYGVEWRDRIDKRERETPGYMIVTPANELDLFVEDAEVVNAILARRRDFEQDSISRTCMNRFGPSLAGSIGESWSRQRRLIAPMLNERIMETVWSESQQQANKMMTYFIDVEGGTTSGTVTGLRKIAFNILSSIGYGMPTDWTADTKERAKDEKMDYMEALHHLIEGLLLLVVFPPRLLKQSWMPKALRQKGEAFYAFFDHSSILLQRERESLKSSGTPRNNFISSLAAVNDQEADSYEQEGQKNKPAFTKEEITGNLYQFTLAGYDTTANTMAYAVAMVVAYPEWQEWILEEVERVQKEVIDPKSYQEVLPKLERCLALMYETLRVFTPVAHIARECAQDQVVTSKGKTYRIPANTRCTLSLDGVGAHKDVWGEDSFEFKPSRWLSKNATPASSSSIAQVPKLQEPPVKGAFLPWSSGPRVCPGMKMAQVEFLSVIWTVFSGYRAEPALEMGEKIEEGRARMAAVVKDSAPKLTLQMNRPADLRLKWIPR